VLVTDGRKMVGTRRKSPAGTTCVKDFARPKNAAVGTRQRPQVIALSPASVGIEENLADYRGGMDRTLVSAGRQLGIRVTVCNFGIQGRWRDHGAVGSETAKLPARSTSRLPAAGSRCELRLHFPEPGVTPVEASLADTRTFLAADDRPRLSPSRWNRSLPVLLGMVPPRKGWENKTRLFAYALEPERIILAHSGSLAFRWCNSRASMLQDTAWSCWATRRVLEPQMVDAL